MVTTRQKTSKPLTWGFLIPGPGRGSGLQGSDAVRPTLRVRATPLDSTREGFLLYSVPVVDRKKEGEAAKAPPLLQDLAELYWSSNPSSTSYLYDFRYSLMKIALLSARAMNHSKFS